MKEKIKKLVISFDRRRFIASIFLIIFMSLAMRLYVLQVHPSTVVQGEKNNHQTEQISAMNYNIYDTTGKNMMNYNKKYIMVLDTKPFSLNNYEETIEDLMALNFIMQSEDPTFSYSAIMGVEGKHYFNISEETYTKINLLKDVKGIYTYVKDEVDRSKAWETQTFLSDLKEENIVEGSIQDTLYKHVGNNKFPQMDYYLDEKAVYSKQELNLGQENRNIKLTVDKDMENKIRDILISEKYDHLKNIGVTVLESSTGNIRSMVQKDETEANINLGIGNSGIEPGSIFKLITEATALEEGLIQTKTGFSCSGSVCLRDNKNYAHGSLSVYDALNVSCNDIFGKVGSLVGYSTLMEYCEKLGLYSRVINFRGDGIDEAMGSKPLETDGMNNISIGQCSTVTPVQMAGAINAIVNNGVYVKPNLVEAIVDNNENVIESFKSEEKVVYSETTSRLVLDNMRAVIKKGNALEANVEGVEVGGKTGTSTGANGTSHGWFAGYCNLEGKKYTIVIQVPDLPDKGPNGEHLGGSNTAGPIFSDIVKLLNSK